MSSQSSLSSELALVEHELMQLRSESAGMIQERLMSDGPMPEGKAVYHNTILENIKGLERRKRQLKDQLKM